jgi:single-strand DNA-binding protein
MYISACKQLRTESGIQIATPLHRQKKHKQSFTLKTRNNMNTLRNKVQLIGHLGMNPEIKVIDSGNKLAKMSIATNESYKNAKGELVKETQWHNLIAWGKTADIIETYLEKGSEIAIEGKLINRSYTDKEGIKRYVTEIQVNEFVMLDKKKPF